MLNWFRSIDWFALTASALILLASLLVVPTKQEETIGYSYESTGDVVPESADDRIADYTHGLELFTALLAIVSIAQGFFLFRSDKTARISADAAKKSADALAATERAQLFLIIYGHGITLRDVKNTYEIRPRSPLTVRCNVVNYGKTPAMIRELKLGIGRLVTDLPSGQWKNLPESEITKDVLAADELLYDAMTLFSRTIEGKTFSDINEEITEEDAVALESGKLFFYFFGHLIYEDVFGADHELQFCWRYASGKFRQWGGKAHNFRT